MSDEKNAKGWKNNGKKFFKKRNNFYSKEEDTSSDEDTDESDNEEMLFIRIDHQEKQSKEAYEIEAEVDYEGELISALDDLREERKKNKILAREVNQLKQRIEEIAEVKKELLHLRKQIREEKETTENLID